MKHVRALTRSGGRPARPGTRRGIERPQRIRKPGVRDPRYDGAGRGVLHREVRAVGRCLPAPADVEKARRVGDDASLAERVKLGRHRL